MMQKVSVDVISIIDLLTDLRCVILEISSLDCPFRALQHGGMIMCGLVCV